MTSRDVKTTTLVGTILEEEVVLSLAEVSRSSRLKAERLIEMSADCVIEPVGRSHERWGCRGGCLRRLRCAQRLQEDLGVNTAGIALVLDLMDELEQLRARLGRLEY